MTRFRKLHLLPSDELRRGVLAGTAAKALCGRRLLRTRDDIDAIKGVDLPLCKQCGHAITALTRNSDVVIRERKGWAQFEKETRYASNYTFRVSINGTWDDHVSGVAS